MEGLKSNEQYGGPEYPGILEAAEIVDRAIIEAQAWDLISSRQNLDVLPVARQERTDNARTAIMEALTASGHLSRIELTGNLEDIHRQVRTRLINGWDDNLPFHEKQRRFAELCNALVNEELDKLVFAGMLPDSVEFAEISDYATALDQKVAESLGYRHENKKGMLRSSRLIINSDRTCTRIIEQISRSNSGYASTFSFFMAAGLSNHEKGPADVVALSKPFLYTTEDYVDGVVDIQRRLDRYGNGLYGDSSNNQHVAYEDLREESAAREQQIELYINKLADFETSLDQAVNLGEISQLEKDELFKAQVHKILEAICSLAPEYAEDCFGKEAAPIFYRASDMVARGDIRGAEQYIYENRDLQQTITFCGVAISAEKAKELGITVSETGELISEGKETWTYKKGVCRIESCSSRPGVTEVGPCSVCKNCQTKFDEGHDPTKDVVRKQKTKEDTMQISLLERVLRPAA